MDTVTTAMDVAPPNPEVVALITPPTRVKRERAAATKANSSIHAMLAKKPQVFKLTQPTTPDFMR